MEDPGVIEAPCGSVAVARMVTKMTCGNVEGLPARGVPAEGRQRASESQAETATAFSMCVCLGACGVWPHTGMQPRVKTVGEFEFIPLNTPLEDRASTSVTTFQDFQGLKFAYPQAKLLILFPCELWAVC